MRVLSPQPIIYSKGAILHACRQYVYNYCCAWDPKLTLVQLNGSFPGSGPIHMALTKLKQQDNGMCRTGEERDMVEWLASLAIMGPSLLLLRRCVCCVSSKWQRDEKKLCGEWWWLFCRLGVRFAVVKKLCRRDNTVEIEAVAGGLPRVDLSSANDDGGGSEGDDVVKLINRIERKSHRKMRILNIAEKEG